MSRVEDFLTLSDNALVRRKSFSDEDLVQAIHRHGTFADAARDLGCTRETVRARAKAAGLRLVPVTDNVAPKVLEMVLQEFLEEDS